MSGSLYGLGPPESDNNGETPASVDSFVNHLSVKLISSIKIIIIIIIIFIIIIITYSVQTFRSAVCIAGC